MSSTNLPSVLQVRRRLQDIPPVTIHFPHHFWKLYNLKLRLSLDSVCPWPPCEDAGRDTRACTKPPLFYRAGSGLGRVSSWVPTHWMPVGWSPQSARKCLWSPARWARRVSHMPANRSLRARYSNAPRPSRLPKAWSSQKLHFVLILCH